MFPGEIREFAPAHAASGVAWLIGPCGCALIAPMLLGSGSLGGADRTNTERRHSN
jgi:hypothetical protein